MSSSCEAVTHGPAPWKGLLGPPGRGLEWTGGPGQWGCPPGVWEGESSSCGGSLHPMLPCSPLADSGAARLFGPRGKLTPATCICLPHPPCPCLPGGARAAHGGGVCSTPGLGVPPRPSWTPALGLLHPAPLDPVTSSVPPSDHGGQLVSPSLSPWLLMPRCPLTTAGLVVPTWPQPPLHALGDPGPWRVLLCRARWSVSTA